MNIPFKQVDVFTSVRFKGNPVAVVLKAEGLTTEQMQQIASWTNLSETTFVVPPMSPQADYRVRIFTPGAEVPFAGHPTIGTAHALLEAALVKARDGELIQECSAGLIPLKIDYDEEEGPRIWFQLPQPPLTPLDSTQVTELEAILDMEVLRAFTPRVVDVGPRWNVAQLANAQEVLSIRPDLDRMKLRDIQLGATGVVIFGEYSKEASARIEVRAFAPVHGVNEDPVCGSGNASVGAFIYQTGQVSHFGSEYLASQGAALGRAGLLHVAVSEQFIRVGGAAVTCIDGHLST